MRDRILFYLNGQRVEVSGDDIFLTLADFIRRRRGLTGTKIVCAEGDCGSCTVMIGRPLNGKLKYSAVTSCIQIVFQLDGVHVVTVEGLRDGAALNPIQKSMVVCHGTQCGFCTPGFVVSLHGLLASPTPVDADKIRRGLTGNLCRCTGYDSILQAALKVDTTQLKSVDALYPSKQMFAELDHASHEPVRIEAQRRLFFKPVTITEATRFRAEHPDCSVIAGGTDLGVVYNKRLRNIDIALSLGGITSLQAHSMEADAMVIGAGCTLSKLQELSQLYLPELGQFMEWFGSQLIRNAGTVGGNIVTGSPIGDTLPALIALEAEIQIAGINTTRTVPISQFYTGYRQTILGTGEIVAGVRIPLLRGSQRLKLYKVSRRKDLDISSFGAAIWLQQSGGIIQEIRLAFGGVGPMVLRMPRTEAALRGKISSLENFEMAGKIAREEVKPITDVRGSAEYRQALAGNILIKFWHESFGSQTATTISNTREQH